LNVALSIITLLPLQVANEVYTFRGVVKEAARDAVKLHYSKYITPPATNFIGNQLQEYDIVSKQVESLLRHNRFTFHGKDKNVSHSKCIFCNAPHI